jgi:hypothetical protein
VIWLETIGAAQRSRGDTWRQHGNRMDAFSDDGAPPTHQPLELLCEDHVGTYVIPFLCRRRNGAWQSLDTDKCIEATLLG